MCVLVFTVTDNLLINLHHDVFLARLPRTAKDFLEFAQIQVSLSLSNGRDVSDIFAKRVAKIPPGGGGGGRYESVIA